MIARKRHALAAAALVVGLAGPALAGTCPGQGNCYFPNGTAGCDDPDCCSLICGDDTFCCDVSWDQFCADAAAKVCGAPSSCPGEGDCHEANGTPGCADPACCEAMCGLDPFCCEIQWDAICADNAGGMCDPTQAPCPADQDGDGHVGVADMLVMLVGWGTDGADLDLDGNGTVGVGDLTLLLMAWGSCP